MIFPASKIDLLLTNPPLFCATITLIAIILNFGNRSLITDLLIFTDNEKIDYPKLKVFGNT